MRERRERKYYRNPWNVRSGVKEKFPGRKKSKGTIHWVAAKTAVKAECRLYENLIDEEKGVYNEDGSMNLNPNSLTVLKSAIWSRL